MASSLSHEPMQADPRCALRHTGASRGASWPVVRLGARPRVGQDSPIQLPLQSRTGFVEDFSSLGAMHAEPVLRRDACRACARALHRWESGRAAPPVVCNARPSSPRPLSIRNAPLVLLLLRWCSSCVERPHAFTLTLTSTSYVLLRGAAACCCSERTALELRRAPRRAPR